MCRLIMANYEPDLAAPRLLFAPPGGYGIDLACVLRRTTYADTRGRVSPYLLYLDHDHADIVLALRGLNLVKESDYALLVDNRLGKRRFDGGYVHNGLLRAAAWVLDSECDLLKDLLHRYPDYTLTFTGHSLGAGVAAMLTMVVVLNLDKLGNFDRARTQWRPPGACPSTSPSYTPTSSTPSSYRSSHSLLLCCLVLCIPVLSSFLLYAHLFITTTVAP
jgi:hypothetical protein